uniref:ABC transporter substrate-binding protein n=1 Tax=mine drainage metagenome TaxID=410659 RepID=E6QJ78_9ZZZZ
MKAQPAMVLLASLWVAGMGTAVAATPLQVAYAGSMGAVMDLHLGPAFAKTHHVTYQGEGQGAYGLAHLIAAKKLRTDVFISVTPGPIKVLEKTGMVSKAVPVASTAMVIAYSPKSRYAQEFAAAAAGKMPWYTVLEKPGIQFGRTDPQTDPQGQNIIFTFLLAQKYYHQPELVQRVLGPVENQKQIFTEASLQIISGLFRAIESKGRLFASCNSRIEAASSSASGKCRYSMPACFSEGSYLGGLLVSSCNATQVASAISRKASCTSPSTAIRQNIRPSPSSRPRPNSTV